jgi:cleavage stimulation factor subunit 2
MTNPDTGKSKGFGFADFQDADSAANAVRNLNDFEIDGRKIRVDWPHNNEKDSVPTNYDQTSAPGGGGVDGFQPQLGGGSNALPPLPPGVDLPPTLRCTDAISQTLSTLPPPQLLDVLTQMKALAISDPTRATALLQSSPQLSFAIFQALILMNLVDPTVLAQVVEQASRPPPQPANVAPPQPTPQQYPGYPPPMMAGQMPPRPAQPQYQAPPQQQPTPQPQAPPQQLSQQEMIQQVLAMDQRTIDSFSPAERAQIMQLRAQLGVR